MKKSRKNKFIRKRGGDLSSEETNPADIDGNSESTLRESTLGDSSPESTSGHGSNIAHPMNQARTEYTMGKDLVNNAVDTVYRVGNMYKNLEEYNFHHGEKEEIPTAEAELPKISSPSQKYPLGGLDEASDESSGEDSEGDSSFPEKPVEVVEAVPIISAELKPKDLSSVKYDDIIDLITIDDNEYKLITISDLLKVEGSWGSRLNVEKENVDLKFYEDRKLLILYPRYECQNKHIDVYLVNRSQDGNTLTVIEQLNFIGILRHVGLLNIKDFLVFLILISNDITGIESECESDKYNPRKNFFNKFLAFIYFGISSQEIIRLIFQNNYTFQGFYEKIINISLELFNIYKNVSFMETIIEQRSNNEQLISDISKLDSSFYINKGVSISLQGKQINETVLNISIEQYKIEDFKKKNEEDKKMLKDEYDKIFGIGSYETTLDYINIVSDFKKKIFSKLVNLVESSLTSENIDIVEQHFITFFEKILRSKKRIEEKIRSPPNFLELLQKITLENLLCPIKKNKGAIFAAIVAGLAIDMIRKNRTGGKSTKRKKIKSGKFSKKNLVSKRSKKIVKKKSIKRRK